MCGSCSLGSIKKKKCIKLRHLHTLACWGCRSNRKSPAMRAKAIITQGWRIGVSRSSDAFSGNKFQWWEGGRSPTAWFRGTKLPGMWQRRTQTGLAGVSSGSVPGTASMCVGYTSLPKSPWFPGSSLDTHGSAQSQSLIHGSEQR